MPYFQETSPSLWQRICGRNEKQLRPVKGIIIFRDSQQGRGIIYPEGENLVVSFFFSKERRIINNQQSVVMPTENLFGRAGQLKFVWQGEK